MRSVEHWDSHQVAFFPDEVTAEDSLIALNTRNAMYPGLLELMPTDVPGEIIDFGCGPGHDTIGFLLNGADHVYAVDSSWNGLSSLRARLRAHGLVDQCTPICVGEGNWRLPEADHIHAAGVVHHLVDPVGTLRKLKASLREGAEIRMMVYAAESQYVRDQGGPEAFELMADGDAPIAKAWTQNEVKGRARAAGLKATYLGGYLMGEYEGPGMGGCWSLR